MFCSGIMGNLPSTTLKFKEIEAKTLLNMFYPNSWIEITSYDIDLYHFIYVIKNYRTLMAA